MHLSDVLSYKFRVIASLGVQIEVLQFFLSPSLLRTVGALVIWGLHLAIPFRRCRGKASKVISVLLTACWFLPIFLV